MVQKLSNSKRDCLCSLLFNTVDWSVHRDCRTGSFMFYVERVAMGLLGLSLAGLLFWRASSKKAREKGCSPSGCGCEAVIDETGSTEIVCDLSAISSADRTMHIENSKALFSSVREARELPDGYTFRLPSDDDSLHRASRFIAAERLCCPFFRFSLEVSAKGDDVWLSLSGNENVKKYLSSNLLADGEVLKLSDDVRVALAV